MVVFHERLCWEYILVTFTRLIGAISLPSFLLNGLPGRFILGKRKKFIVMVCNISLPGTGCASPLGSGVGMEEWVGVG